MQHFSCSWPCRREDQILGIALSPDGSLLAAGMTGGQVVVWEVANDRKPKWDQKVHEQEVSSVAFSRDGRQIVSASWEGKLRRWDAATGAPLRVMRLFPDGADEPRGPYVSNFRATFSPDGRHLVTANANGTVYILRLATANQ